VKFDDLDTVLPASTPRVTAEQRAAAMAARRAGVNKRFPR
jgi:hypothetical protein